MTMQMLSTRFRYGAVAQFFHWTTAVLVVAAYATGPGGSEQQVYSSAIDFSRQIHETLGAVVFMVVLLRMFWRLFDAAPEDPPMKPWMKHASSVVHAALYSLLIALPVTAIAGAWLEGHPLTLLGLGNIDPMLPQSHQIGSVIAAVHTTLGNVILWIAGVHAGAALIHHFYLRDRVLVSMLPGRSTSD
jgi:cytochrome b561